MPQYTLLSRIKSNTARLENIVSFNRYQRCLLQAPKNSNQSPRCNKQPLDTSRRPTQGDRPTSLILTRLVQMKDGLFIPENYLQKQPSTAPCHERRAQRCHAVLVPPPQGLPCACHAPTGGYITDTIIYRYICTKMHSDAPSRHHTAVLAMSSQQRNWPRFDQLNTRIDYQRGR